MAKKNVDYKVVLADMKERARKIDAAIKALESLIPWLEKYL